MNERDFSSDQRKKAAKSGAAMKDGSYPIENVGDLKNAIQAIGRASNPAAVKAHIKSRAASLGATHLLPDTWESARLPLGSFVALTEAEYKPSTGQITLTVIKPGMSKNNRFYSESLLKSQHKIFEGAKMFVDHQTDQESQRRPEGSVKDWVATVKKTWTDQDGTVRATAAVHDESFKKSLENLAKNGDLGQMGVSIRAIGEATDGKVNGQACKVIESLVAARSVDFVTIPAAGGQVNVLESSDPNDGDLWDEATFRSRRPDLVALIEAQKESTMELKEMYAMSAGDHDAKSDRHQAMADKLKAGDEKDAHQDAADAHEKAADAIRAAHKTSQMADCHTSMESTGGENVTNAEVMKENKELKEKLAAVELAGKKTAAQAVLTGLLTEAKLPEVSSNRLKQQFSEVVEDKGMKEAVEAEKAYIETLSKDTKITRNNGSAQPIAESDQKIEGYKRSQYETYKRTMTEAEARGMSGYKGQ